MGKCKELTGMRFGKLQVIKQVISSENNQINPNSQWLCRCDCGVEKAFLYRSLMYAKRQSCGCLSVEMLNQYNKKYNSYDLFGEIGVGYTTKGEEFYFDLEDYDKIKDYCWFLNGSGYAMAKIKNQRIFMHKLVLNVGNDSLIDHIDRNRTNNRKSNLRICEKSDNNINIKLRKDNTSGVTGVYWIEADGGWHAMLHYKHQKYIRRCKTYEDAVRARLLLEVEILGWKFAPQKHLFKKYGIVQ
jgi:hypothetical protein